MINGLDVFKNPANENLSPSHQAIVVANQSWEEKWQRETEHFEKCTIL